MSDQYPGLQVTLIEDDPEKAGLLVEQFDTFGVACLGRLASNQEVFAAFDEIKHDTGVSNLITDANVLFVDGNLGLQSSGCGDGNQIIGHMIRTGLAITPRYYRYADDRPFPRVIFGCSADPRNAYGVTLGEYNYDVRKDPTTKLRGMLQIANLLLRDGTRVEPVIP